MGQIEGGAAADTNPDHLKIRRANRWHSSGIIDRGSATGALSADTMYAAPFYTPIAITVTDIAIEVTTSATGDARLGIYDDDGDAYPDALILDAGTVDTGTNGEKIITVSQALAADTLHWLVVVSDATATIRFQQTISIPTFIGASAISTGGATHWSVSFTFAGLPNPFTSGGTAETSSPKRVMIQI